MVDANNLTKTFGSLLAVDHVNINVKKSEIFGFLGPNGAGKTTTVRLLCCLLSPTSGSATVAGYDILEQPEKVRENIGLLPEVHGHYERMSAQENLNFYAQLYDVPKSEMRGRVKDLIETMGLWERRNDKVGTYSKGMKQKLAIARALIHDPPALFLDEPTSALDPEAQKKIRDDILVLSKRRDRTIFLCTHNLAEAEMLCDRIAIINHGKIVALGETEHLRTRLWRLRTFELTLTKVSSRIVEAIESVGLCKKIEVKGNSVIFSVSNPDHDNPIITKKVIEAGGRIISLSEIKRTLEEIYLKIIGEKS